MLRWVAHIFRVDNFQKLQELLNAIKLLLAIPGPDNEPLYQCTGHHAICHGKQELSNPMYLHNQVNMQGFSYNSSSIVTVNMLIINVIIIIVLTTIMQLTLIVFWYIHYGGESRFA